MEVPLHPYITAWSASHATSRWSQSELSPSSLKAWSHETACIANVITAVEIRLMRFEKVHSIVMSGR